MINGVPQSKAEYDAIINPDEYARKMRILEQGMMNAKQNNAKKVKMIESRQRWIKRRELADRYGV
ncbi:MAG: hypothetical protein KBD65_02960 [Candidatus Moranbacteria bacterium]|nr:hypothetical protein [Candidatus Moranbacteria bacterium]